MLNSTAWPEIVAQYGRIQMLIYALETELPRNSQSPGTGSLWRWSDLKGKMNYCKAVKDVEEIEIQLLATNPKVYNSGTGQIDKSDKHTNTPGQPRLHCFEADI